MPVMLLDTAQSLTNAGMGWSCGWEALLTQKRNFTNARELDSRLPSVPIAIVPITIPHATRERGMAALLGCHLKATAARLLGRLANRRIGCVVSTSHGESGAISDMVDADNNSCVEPSTYASLLSDHAGTSFLDSAGLDATLLTHAGACASGLQGVGIAASYLEAGLLDACVVVAVDAISRVAIAGFRQVGACSKGGCRPFDRERDGTTVGEGGAAVVLVSDATWQTLDGRAEHSGVRIGGWSQNCEARSPVEPSATGIAAAIREALARSGELSANDIDAVFWHGTGTQQNDAAEAAAAKLAFGSACPVGTSTKGVFGHTMGASGLLNLLAAAQSCLSDTVPPVAGLQLPAFLEFPLVKGEPLKARVRRALVVSLGFGGINASMVVQRFERGQ